MKNVKIILSLGFICIFALLAGCESNNEVNEEVVIETTIPEVTEVVSDAVGENDTISDGYALKVETLGNVHWDGTQVATTTLGLEAGEVYEFFARVKIVGASGDIGLVLQANEPNWTFIASTGEITNDEWHDMRGVLDLSNVDEFEFTHIQIVKDQSFALANENTTFLVDEFYARRTTGGVNEELIYVDFASGRTSSFIDRGHVLLSTVATSDIAYIEVLNLEWDLTLPSLAEIYSNYFLFGNILEPTLISNNTDGVIDMFLRQYNALTAENSMKPDAVSGGGSQTTRPNSLNLNPSELMVSFAEEFDLYMVGHTLVWHEQSAPWLNFDSATGEYLTRAEAMENMRWFIEQYAGHFEGRVDAWDVANEVFTNNGTINSPSDSPADSPIYDSGTWQRALRNYAPWYQAFANGADFEAGERGWDYIYYAFVFTRRYAPSAVLIYNDFNEETPSKRDAIADMVIELNERWANDVVNNPAANNPDHEDYNRLLIEVIGMQAHYNQGTNLSHVRAALERFVETGARIHVTELDIQFTNAFRPFDLHYTQLEEQANMFAQLFAWYIEFADYIDRVSIWGREDGSSWRGSNGATHFDRHLDPKPAFWAIVDPIEWLLERSLLD